MDVKKHSISSTIVYVLLAFAAILIMGAMTMGLVAMRPIGYLIRCVLYCSLVFVVIRHLALVYGITLEECRITPPRFTFIGICVAILLPTLMLLYQIHGQEGLFIVNQSLEKEYIIDTILYLLFYTGFCSGIVEEIVFRGFMTGVCEQQFGRKFALVIPTILFILPHLRNHNDATSMICGSAFYVGISVLCTVIAYRSNSVWDSVLVHAFWDIFAARGAVVAVSSEVVSNAFITYVLADEANHPLMNVTGNQNLLVIAVMLFMISIIVLGVTHIEKRLKVLK